MATVKQSAVLCLHFAIVELGLHVSLIEKFINQWVVLCRQKTRMWGYSSGVEHLTADQKVSGSNPDAPCFMSNLNTFLHTSADTVSS